MRFEDEVIPALAGWVVPPPTSVRREPKAAERSAHEHRRLSFAERVERENRRDARGPIPFGEFLERVNRESADGSASEKSVAHERCDSGDGGASRGKADKAGGPGIVPALGDVPAPEQQRRVEERIRRTYFAEQSSPPALLIDIVA